MVEFHGDSVLANFTLQGAEISVMVPAAQRPAVGERASLGFAEEDIHLFNASSENSLRL